MGKRETGRQTDKESDRKRERVREGKFKQIRYSNKNATFITVSTTIIVVTIRKDEITMINMFPHF